MNKKKIVYILLLSLALTFISSIPLYQDGIFNAQDLTFHLSRIEGVLQCLQDHQFPFAIYPFKNYSYGYASPLFYCDIFLILPALLYRLDFSLVCSYKIFIFLIIFIGELLFSYTYLYITKDEKTTFIASILWSFSSYRITDVFIRGALGETLALTFLPLLILACYKIFVENKNNYILLAISFDLILFSHNITFFISVLVFALICILYIKKIITSKRLILCLCKATLLSIFIAAFYLFPMLEQMLSQEFVMNQSLGNMLENGMNFSRLFDDFIFQELKYDINHPLSYSFDPGLFMVIFLPFIFITKTNNARDSFIKKISIITIICLVFSTNLTSANILKMFGFIQFPWRTFTIVSTFSPLVSAYCLRKIDNQNVYRSITVLILLFTIANITTAYRQIINTNDQIINSDDSNTIFVEQKYKPFANIMHYNISELGGGEYLPTTYNFDYKQMGSCIAYPNYDAAICDYDRHGTTIKFTSNLEWKENLLLPLSYYKGYEGYEIDSDGNIIKQLDLFPEQYSKRVTFSSDTGIHHYIVKYQGTTIQKVSTVISGFSIIFVFFVIYKRKINQNNCK